MKAIQTGTTFKIYDDGLIIHDQLPSQVYQVNFNPLTGPFLSKYSDIEVNEKVYGVHETKVNKVLNAYKQFQRNLGVILSGDKGIGKSLFAKLLAIECTSRGMPVVIVSSYFPGIADYIASIEQEVMVMFDEFDKTFSMKDGDAQAEMLTLFDGLAQGKKMYVITCNCLTGLNDYLVNRPGRFHYHFRFQYPTPEEIRQYLSDKLNREYWGEIEKVVTFAAKVDVNYDCLRAIAFELNNGIEFEEAVLDLNIMNIQKERFNVVVYFESGAKIVRKNIALDLFGADEFRLEIEDEDYNTLGFTTFIPGEATWINELGGNVILGKNVKWEVSDYYDRMRKYEAERNANPEQLAEWKENNPECDPLEYTKYIEPYDKVTHIQFIRQMGKSLHYQL